MNLLVFTSLWPNAEQPAFAPFVRHRIAAMAARANVEIRVVAPVPYFPRGIEAAWLPDRWRRAARVPDRERIAGLETFHPRYLVTPKLGMRFYSRWMARAAAPLVRRLHAERPFDLVDAHYVYPDGHAAVLLARELGLPIVLTARGSDIHEFAGMRAIRPRIRRALADADGVIAVSESLRSRILELGIEEGKCAVIPNGIDRDAFFPQDRAQARRALGLEADARILLTVASLTPVKGVERLIDAVARLQDDRLRLYVLGEGPLRAALAARIASRSLGDRVLLAGARPQADLPRWYAAADLFCLASHREGAPNVLREALACGLPVLASRVGGIPELLPDDACGFTLPDPSPAAFAAAISRALAQRWDRDAIAARGGARSWTDVAEDVFRFYAARGLS